tara:strand:+ start:1303 stop:2385 length:1083 start_codon:yes stop_codon:yes gene_type:complete
MQLLPPHSIIGILGGGQLGKMLAIAASKLGYGTHVFANNNDEPATQVCNFKTISKFSDTAALDKFARSCNVITYEFENIPIEAVEKTNNLTNVYPKPKSLQVAQDRLLEKKFLIDCGIKVSPFFSVSNFDELVEGFDKLNSYGILKTRRLGYDGKGQFAAESKDEVFHAWERLNRVPCIFEQKINFQKEISSIITRTAIGETVEFDISENNHKNGILINSKVPADISLNSVIKAKEISKLIAEKLDHVGTMAVEMFLCNHDEILVNEIAPRVHNTGHWTIDACYTDQFEQHIRAICGLKLGESLRHSDAIMTNLIGKNIDQISQILSSKTTKLHLYGKKEVKEGRKMGHKTELFPIKKFI